MIKLLIGILLAIAVALSSFACQKPAATTTTTPPQIPTTPVTTTPVPTAPTITTPAPTTPAPTTPAPTTPPPVVTPPPVTTTPTTPAPTTPLAPQPVLPVLSSIRADKTSAELFSALVRITAVFAFTDKSEPGFYSISLVSGSDNFGAKDIAWYRGTGQFDLTWVVPPDNSAYNRLKNNELVSTVFQAQVSYKKFVSLTTVPRETPTELENQIVAQVNQQRLNRGLSQLTWDTELYKTAIPRLTAFGEEGAVIPPPASQPYLETAYSAGGGAPQNAVTIFESWLTSDKYNVIIFNPNAKSFAIRTDIFSNQKFFAVGLFKIQ